MEHSADRELGIHRLHEIVDAEVEQAVANEDEATAVPDTELQAYLARLSNLHGAVVAMEEFESGPTDR